MTSGWMVHWAAVLGAALGLSGCEEAGKAPDGLAAPAVANASVGRNAATRDIERADIFTVTDRGLWDGRPSLGGIWVAHAAVGDAERVLVRNTANGVSIEAALFRRDINNPGPALQVSSDAAEALGMIAGQPAELYVVVLRREVAPPEAPAPAQSAAAEAEPAAAPTAEPAAAPAAKPASPEAEAAAIAAAAAAAVSETGEPPAPAKRKWWQPKPKGEVPEAAAADPVIDEEPVTPVETGAIEAAPLDAAKPAAPAAGTAPAEADAKPVEAPVATVATVADAASLAGGGSLSMPFIQVAVLSGEEEALALVEVLKAEGVTAEARQRTRNRRIEWLILAGPAADLAARNEISKKLTELGYKKLRPAKG